MNRGVNSPHRRARHSSCWRRWRRGDAVEKVKQKDQKAAQQEEKPQQEQAQNQEQQPQQQGGGGQEPALQKPSFGDSTYQVETDVQPGTYRTREGSPNCYNERLKGFTGDMNSLIANGNTNNPTIVTIAPTDAGFQSQSCGTWTEVE
jgi:transcription initiation factor TFIID subunit TAF12